LHTPSSVLPTPGTNWSWLPTSPSPRASTAHRHAPGHPTESATTLRPPPDDAPPAATAYHAPRPVHTPRRAPLARLANPDFPALVPHPAPTPLAIPLLRTR